MLMQLKIEETSDRVGETQLVGRRCRARCPHVHSHLPAMRARRSERAAARYPRQCCKRTLDHKGAAARFTGTTKPVVLSGQTKGTCAKAGIVERTTKNVAFMPT